MPILVLFSLACAGPELLLRRCHAGVHGQIFPERSVRVARHRSVAKCNTLDRYSAFPPGVLMPEPLLAHIARGVLQVEAVRRRNQQTALIVFQGLAALQTRPHNIIHRSPLRAPI